jgi:hypothetical protein
MIEFMSRTLEARTEEQSEQEIFNPETRTTVIIQLNAVPFLHREMKRRGLPPATTLADLPDDSFMLFKETGVDILYFLGVYPESPYARQIAEKYGDEHLQGLNLSREHLRGSIFAVPTEEEFHRKIAKSNSDFLSLRERLHRMGLKVMLDDIPNHTAVDTMHKDLTLSFPEDYLQYVPEDAHHNFFLREGVVYAYGKDESQQEWCDTTQHRLHDIFVQDQLIERTIRLMKKADGLRFDMAHLATLRSYVNSWMWAGITLTEEDRAYLQSFWERMSKTVEDINPNFLMIAEAYGESVDELYAFFNGVYDKQYYDYLAKAARGEVSASEVRGKLAGRLKFEHKHKSVRFLQNHDEPPAQEIFGPLTLPFTMLEIFEPSGHLFIPDSQLFGFSRKLPVQVDHYPNEPESMYTTRLITREVHRRTHEDIFVRGRADVLVTDSDQIVGYEYATNTHGALVCINMTGREAFSAVYTSDGSYLTGGISVDNNSNLPAVHTGRGSKKTVRLKPYETQILYYRK